MAKRGENIYKRKDGRWEGRYKNGVKPNGKPQYSSIYGHSYSEVRNILIRKKAESKPSRVKCRLTFGELAELWLESLRNRVKESTLSNYRMKLQKHIIPRFGEIKYENLTAKILSDYIEEKIRSGLSARYVSDISREIKSITRFARIRLGYEDKAELFTPPRVEKSAREAFPSIRSELLIPYVNKNPSASGIGVLIAMTTGIRIGEICALKWSDIDLSKRIITVDRTLQRIKNTTENTATKIIVTSPKSKASRRRIPIPEILYPTLKRLQNSEECYVLTGKDRFTEPRTIQYGFKKILKAVGLPDVNFHMLRHMFATNCIAAGVDVKTLSEILGHSSVEITLNRYVHSPMERKTECMRLFSDSISKEIKKL